MEKAIYLTPEELKDKAAKVSADILSGLIKKGVDSKLIFTKMLNYSIFSVKLCEEFFGKYEKESED